MVGKNGTAAESGTTFTGAITASYKVSQFFAFQIGAVPTPGAAALLGAAGLLSRRRKA
jgi:MYXO-CTERM domain-containing protein